MVFDLSNWMPLILVFWLNCEYSLEQYSHYHHSLVNIALCWVTNALLKINNNKTLWNWKKLIFTTFCYYSYELCNQISGQFLVRCKRRLKTANLPLQPNKIYVLNFILHQIIRVNTDTLSGLWCLLEPNLSYYSI